VAPGLIRVNSRINAFLGAIVRRNFWSFGIVLVLCFAALPGVSNAAKRSQSMKHPVFVVRIEAAGGAVDVLMNDGPFFQTDHPAPFQTEVPDISWARPGTNEISCRLSPARGQTALDPGAECLLIVYMHENGANPDTRTEITRLAYHVRGASEVIGKTESTSDGVTIRRTFEADAPFPNPEWLSAPVIQDTPETLAGLIGELKNFYKLLETKNMSGILAVLDARDRVRAAHLYQSLEAQREGTRQEYSMVMDSTDMVLRPVIEKNVKLRLFGQGRLARVDLQSNQQSPLYFVAKDKTFAAYVTLIFCKTPTGSWAIVS
jgi:hypothetical protein